MRKRTLTKTVFSKRLKVKQNTAKIGADFSMNFDFHNVHILSMNGFVLS